MDKNYALWPSLKTGITLGAQVSFYSSKLLVLKQGITSENQSCSKIKQITFVYEEISQNPYAHIFHPQISA